MPAAKRKTEKEEGSSDGASTEKRARKNTKPQKFTREEDLIILEFIEECKSIPELCKRLPDRGHQSVRQRWKLLLDRLRATAGQ